MCVLNKYIVIMNRIYLSINILKLYLYEHCIKLSSGKVRICYPILKIVKDVYVFFNMVYANNCRNIFSFLEETTKCLPWHERFCIALGQKTNYNMCAVNFFN